MRLIDADKLKIDMDCNIDFGGINNRLMALEQIDNAPTVDAIPIDVSVEEATNGDVFDCVFGGIAGYVTETEKHGLMGQIALNKWANERFPYLTTTNKWLETPYKQIER